MGLKIGPCGYNMEHVFGPFWRRDRWEEDDGKSKPGFKKVPITDLYIRVEEKKKK